MDALPLSFVGAPEHEEDEQRPRGVLLEDEDECAPLRKRTERTERREEVPERRGERAVRGGLSAVLRALVGTAVVVELKSDAEVRGVLVGADDAMNLTLADAETEAPRADALRLEVAQVAGSSIRYVHIDPSLDLRRHVSAHLKKLGKIAKANAPRPIKR